MRQSFPALRLRIRPVAERSFHGRGANPLLERRFIFLGAGRGNLLNLGKVKTERDRFPLVMGRSKRIRVRIW